MPGIVGVIGRRPPHECVRMVEHMLASMRHETFYAQTVHSDYDLGVFAGCLAMTGSSSDGQPFFSEDGNVILLLSGECFADLDSEGQPYRREHRGKASPLPGLYETRGDRFFAELNGTFSGLLIDKRRRRSFLFNDRYGMDRLYYHEGVDGLFFASEAKALLGALPELRCFDDDGLMDFLEYGCTLEWRSLFRNVKILPGGSVVSFQGGAYEKRHYFVPSVWESQSPLSVQSFETQFQGTFDRVLPRYFQSDSEIGMSLTAGLDTRLIMSRRPRTEQRFVAYTFAGPDADTLDVRLAARVASAARTPHHVLRLGGTFFSQFPSVADKTVYVTDGAFGICGTHEIYLNRLARELAPVRLTGNFGGEIARGVTTFKPLALSDDLLGPELRRRLSERRATAVAATNMSPISVAAFREIPWHLFGVVKAAQSQVTTRTPYLDNDLVALAFRAPRELRSALPAIHLIRQDRSGLDRIVTDKGVVPASPMATLSRSFWYRLSFKLDYHCQDGMPHWLSSLGSTLLDALSSRPNVGNWLFGPHRYLHYRGWFRKELADYVRERLAAANVSQSHLWDRDLSGRLAAEHIKGRKNYVREINAVLTIEAIDRLLLKGLSTFKR